MYEKEVKMNRKGLTQIQRVGIGAVLGASGLVIMSFGAVSSSNILLRVGIILTTIGGWLISWK